MLVIVFVALLLKIPEDKLVLLTETVTKFTDPLKYLTTFGNGRLFMETPPKLSVTQNRFMEVVVLFMETQKLSTSV